MSELADGFAQKISEHAVTILVNLSGDKDVLETLATDDKFLELVFSRIVVSSALAPFRP